MMELRTICSRAFLGLTLVFSVAAPALAADRVTILYDAFGSSEKVKKDWGFAALVEHAGKRILFDTGNNAEIFAGNVKAMGVDLSKLDFVVISHRHGDHTSGLSYLLKVNPKVKIYVPAEMFGPFGSNLPKGFYKSVESLPDKMRYFGGAEAEAFTSGTPWPGANFVAVDSLTEAAPGIFLVLTVSKVPGTIELRELSLAVDTGHGLMLVVGCSHPGIEEILRATSTVNAPPRVLIGGLHLVKTPDSEIERLAKVLREQWKLEHIAPGHCTGEPAFSKLKEIFQDSYLYAGVGSVLEIP